MSSQRFRIEFDNPSGNFVPGETIKGKVFLIIVDHPRTVEDLKLVIRGFGKVSYDKKKDDSDNEDESSNVINYHAEEEYFKNYVSLLSGELELHPGSYDYPFSCTLISSLPSSFESKYGHIRYSAEASFNSSDFLNPTATAEFTVTQPVDLNQMSDVSESIMLEESKIFCCFCCGSPPINMNVSMPTRGFVSGETITVKVDIENLSGVDVERVRIEFRKIVTYYANTPSEDEKDDKYTILEELHGTVRGNETVNFEKKMKLPSYLTPSNLEHCNIMDLEYKLKVKACVEGLFRGALRINIPIVIGTIPFINKKETYSSNKSETASEQESHAPSAPSLEELNTGSSIGWFQNKI